MATPTQKTVMFTGSNIRPMPPPVKPTKPIATLVQAAQVSPWFADMRAPLELCGVLVERSRPPIV